MDDRHQSNGKEKRARVAVITAAALFALYTINVLIGKAIIIYGWHRLWA
jgi:hypothetical protein